ncbi:MAG TPA: hypothetical protein VHP83_05375 [Aggregatilineaceae bacterium]|nr:hypothetical protein [Aggregatilineaceae bacterium]
MAKKTTRPNIPQATLERARKELYGGGTAEVTSTTATSEMAAVGTKKVVRVKREANLREEYAYVIKDLRNMVMLASALMAMLLLLAITGVV